MDILKNKYLLLDTNILIYAVKYLRDFQPFFEELKVLHITPLIDETIKLEFLRTATNQKNLDLKINYLSLLLGDNKNRIDLPITSQTLIDARRLSNLFHHLNIKKQSISVADSILGAQLKKYTNSGVYLATINHKDFPLKIFDRVCIKNIETSDELYTIGIYRFSETKYNHVVDRFTSSG